jgi:hypothetical protein
MVKTPMSESTHRYHAEASALKGTLILPISQEIEPQVHAKLPEVGGYLTQRADLYRLESIISFRSAYTHVSGALSDKSDGGHTTLTTTVVEGLNVMEVVTADRIVGQMITDHPLEGKGYIPSISFLGTRIENLRIAGEPIELQFDHDIFGSKPVDDLPYTADAGFVSRVNRQYQRIRQNKNLPTAVQERYNRLFSTLGTSEEVECSLIDQVAGFVPGTIAGNVITIPGFGTITLAKLTVKHEDPHEQTNVPTKTTFHLTMMDLKLGCAVHGNVPIGNGTSNGGPT